MQLWLYMRSVRYTLQMFANFGLKFAFVWKGFQIFAQGAFSQKIEKLSKKLGNVEKQETSNCPNKKSSVIIKQRLS